MPRRRDTNTQSITILTFAKLPRLLQLKTLRITCVYVQKVDVTTIVEPLNAEA